MNNLQLLFLFLLGNFLTDGKQLICNTKYSCGCSKTNVELGEQSIPYSWSMIVSVQYDYLHNGNSSIHICEGTILTDSFILTSANCVKTIMKDVKKNQISIRDEKSQERKVDKILIHPNWTKFF